MLARRCDKNGVDHGSMDDARSKLDRVRERINQVWNKVTQKSRDGSQSDIRSEARDPLRYFLAGIHDTVAPSDTEARDQTYLDLMVLMVYTARLSIQVCLKALESLRSGFKSQKFRNEEEAKQVIFVVKALNNAQVVWHQLLKAPWSLACCLHLLVASPATVVQPSDTTASRQEFQRPQSQDGPNPVQLQDHGHQMANVADVFVDDHHNVDNDPFVSKHPDGDDENNVDEEAKAVDDDPEHDDEADKKLYYDVPEPIHPVLQKVQVPAVKAMMEQSFRLGSVTRRQHEAETDIVSIIDRSMRNTQQPESFSMEFMGNTSTRSYNQGEILKLVEDYWRRMPTSEKSREGFALLSDIARTKRVKDLGLSLGPPRAHCECILAQRYNSQYPSTLPPIGVSRVACGTCSLFIDAMLDKVYQGKKPSIERIVPGTRSDAFWPCSVPGGTPPEVTQSVAERLHKKLEERLGEEEIITSLRRYKQWAEGGEVYKGENPPGTPGSNKADSDHTVSPEDFSHNMGPTIANKNRFTLHFDV